MVNGDHSTSPVPPLRTVQLDSQSVVGAEAPGRLRSTKLPPAPANSPLRPRTHPLRLRIHRSGLGVDEPRRAHLHRVQRHPPPSGRPRQQGRRHTYRHMTSVTNRREGV
eukprot:1187705-Prorocentrum_minimum.AAC.3